MKKIIVIGAGGIGSYFIPLLQKHLTVEDVIVVMDGDKFEKKNLDRQLFTKRYLGKNKATAMAQMYASDESAKLEAIESYFSDVKEVVERFEADEIIAIVACPDNHPARLRCMQFADAVGVPAILCGNEMESASAMVYHPRYKDTKADPRVVYPALLAGDDHDPTHACTGAAQVENRQLANANFMAAGLGMSLLYKHVLSPVSDAAKIDLPFELSWSVWGTEPSTSIRQMIEQKGEDDHSGKA